MNPLSEIYITLSNILCYLEVSFLSRKTTSYRSIPPLCLKPANRNHLLYADTFYNVATSYIPINAVLSSSHSCTLPTAQLQSICSRSPIDMGSALSIRLYFLNYISHIRTYIFRHLSASMKTLIELASCQIFRF